MATLLKPEERVLATLNADGSRRWITPRLAKGRTWRNRRAVGYILIAVFVLLPFLRMNGKPPLLLDIMERQFTFFGTTFYPTDTLLLSLLLMTIFVSIFLLTALFGRVWCGWACPQTVYMEFLFRPIDRLFGTGGYSKSPLGCMPKGVRSTLRFVVFVGLSFLLAHVFLSYFVGTDRLFQWVFTSPLAHPFGFGIVVAVTAAMLFNFGFFREQLCLVACPYGRFQSVMLDTRSLIVGYDLRRGEPRGKGKRTRVQKKNKKSSVSENQLDRGSVGDVRLDVLPHSASHGCRNGISACGSCGPESAGHTETSTVDNMHDTIQSRLGDCVDCTMCVQVCPTGIDIRNGLQLECIHCAQCIDACDSVMTKLNMPTGLIRYSTQTALEGKPSRRLRARVLIYPTILAILLTALVAVVASKGTYSSVLLRDRGLPYNVLPSGDVTNQIRLRVTNRSPQTRFYTIAGEGLELRAEPLVVEPGETKSTPVLLIAPRSAFSQSLQIHVPLVVQDDLGVTQSHSHTLLGPSGSGGASQ